MVEHKAKVLGLDVERHKQVVIIKKNDWSGIVHTKYNNGEMYERIDAREYFLIVQRYRENKYGLRKAITDVFITTTGRKIELPEKIIYCPCDIDTKKSAIIVQTENNKKYVINYLGKVIEIPKDSERIYIGRFNGRFGYIVYSTYEWQKIYGFIGIDFESIEII